MATPVANSVPLTGNPLIDGLVQGSSWQFGGGPHVLTYSFSINDTPNGGPWTPALATAFTQALTAWSNVANITFVQQGSGGVFTQSTADIAAALTGNELQQGLGAISLGIFPDPAFANVLESAVGYDRATYPHPEGDVFFDNSFFAFNNVAPGGAGLAYMLHELGHALGLKHPSDDGGNFRPTFDQLGISAYRNYLQTVMDVQSANANTAIGGAPTTPMPLDILAIQAIYGANMSYHTGNNTYQLLPYPNTIWDAGGSDTLDASNLTYNATIDLREGMFSNSFPTMSTTAIAYGVTIENAFGGSGNDVITGNDADNYISGGSGADVMTGGGGNDTYVLDYMLDQVIENPGAGTDLVQSFVTLLLPANVENLTLIGTANINGTGNNADNLIIGNSGNNTLTGGGGNDTMAGGNGNDAYVVDTPGEVIIENPGEGTDTVQSSVTFVLPANVEYLTLTGTAGINGTGSSDDNVIVGNSGDNILAGGSGNDSLNGGGGNDTLVGGTGNDTFVMDSFASSIRGGPTSFQFQGQTGDYISQGQNISFNSADLNATASLFENPQGLVDWVRISFQGTVNNEFRFWYFDFSTRHLPGDPAFAPGQYLNAERASFAGDGHPGLDISGDGRGSNQVYGSFTVNAADFDYTNPNGPTITDLSISYVQHSESPTAPTLTGTLYFNSANAPATANLPSVVFENANEGIDTVQTSLDGYVLPANVENLTLTGSSNLIGTGNALDNTFISNSGIDTLAGGLGNDIYFLNNAGDVVTENLGEGTDTVVAGFSYTLVGTNLENVTLTGSSNLTATGNAFDNVLTSNTGIDTLTGGLGDDTYVLNNAADTVVENPGEGTDTIATSFGYLLTVGSNLENVTLFGSDPVNATGDGLDNVITGNSAPNVLTGGLGNDTLIGGFALDTALFSGLMSSYTITHTGTLGTVTGPDGTDNFSSVERLQFDDQSLSFVVPKNDFNGDGHSDILWHNANGHLALWQMNGATLTSAGAVAGGAQVSADWHIATITDFSGDGTTDILWRNNSGTVAEWNMNGTAIASAGLVAGGAAVSSDWQIAGVGDFGGDGKSDILWHNTNGQLSMWQMDGSTLLSAGTVVSIPTAWQIAAVADFDGDGKSDILWRHSSGTVAEWNMNGMALASGGAVAGGAVVTSDWQIAGVGDFGGDGKNDILWQNTNGQLAIWQMDGSTLLSAGVAVGGAAVSADWHLAGVADFNGDDKSDILWRNDNGVVAEWNMNGHTMAQGGVVNNGTPVSTDWILNAI